MFWLWVRTRQGEWQREADYRCGAQRHRCRHEDLEGGTWRSSGGEASLPLPDVGKGFLATVHCWQQDPKEPHCNRGCEADGLIDHITPTTIYRWVSSPRMGSSREPIVLPSIQHQALHGWGIMWRCSPWCLWCIIRPTILVEETCCAWVKASCCYCYLGK